MKDNEFKEKLSQVADWELVKIKLDSDTKRRLSYTSRKNIEQEELYELEQELAFYEQNNGTNPSIPPEVTKLHCKDEACNDCGKICHGGRKMEHKKYFKQDKSIWRHKCLNCNLTIHPETQQFSLSTHRANTVWNLYLNQKGYRKYKQK